MLFLDRILHKVHNIFINKRFHKIGSGCGIARDSVIVGYERIAMGNNVVVSSGSRIQSICEYDDGHLKVEYFPQIEIGSNVLLMRNVCIYCANSLIIEDNVTVSSDVFITDENHGMDPRVGNYLHQPLITAPVKICKGAWLGQKVSVMPGVTIGENAIIGAGAVVTKDIPANSMAVGVPAKVIRQFSLDTGKWETIKKPRE